MLFNRTSTHTHTHAHTHAHTHSLIYLKRSTHVLRTHILMYAPMYAYTYWFVRYLRCYFSSYSWSRYDQTRVLLTKLPLFLLFYVIIIMSSTSQWSDEKSDDSSPEGPKGPWGYWGYGCAFYRLPSPSAVDSDVGCRWSHQFVPRCLESKGSSILFIHSHPLILVRALKFYETEWRKE